MQVSEEIQSTTDTSIKIELLQNLLVSAKKVDGELKKLKSIFFTTSYQHYREQVEIIQDQWNVFRALFDSVPQFSYLKRELGEKITECQFLLKQSGNYDRLISLVDHFWNIKHRLEVEDDILHKRRPEKIKATVVGDFELGNDITTAILLRNLESCEDIKSFCNEIKSFRMLSHVHKSLIDKDAVFSKINAIFSKITVSTTDIDPLVLRAVNIKSFFWLNLLLAHPTATPELYCSKKKLVSGCVGIKYSRKKDLATGLSNLDSCRYSLAHLIIQADWLTGFQKIFKYIGQEVIDYIPIRKGILSTNFFIFRSCVPLQIALENQSSSILDYLFENQILPSLLDTLKLLTKYGNIGYLDKKAIDNPRIFKKNIVPLFILASHKSVIEYFLKKEIDLSVDQILVILSNIKIEFFHFIFDYFKPILDKRGKELESSPSKREIVCIIERIIKKFNYSESHQIITFLLDRSSLSDLEFKEECLSLMSIASIYSNYGAFALLYDRYNKLYRFSEDDDIFKLLIKSTANECSIDVEVILKKMIARIIRDNKNRIELFSECIEILSRTMKESKIRSKSASLAAEMLIEDYFGEIITCSETKLYLLASHLVGLIESAPDLAIQFFNKVTKILSVLKFLVVEISVRENTILDHLVNIDCNKLSEPDRNMYKELMPKVINESKNKTELFYYCVNEIAGNISLNTTIQILIENHYKEIISHGGLTLKSDLKRLIAHSPDLAIELLVKISEYTPSLLKPLLTKVSSDGSRIIHHLIYLDIAKLPQSIRKIIYSSIEMKDKDGNTLLHRLLNKEDHPSHVSFSISKQFKEIISNVKPFNLSAVNKQNRSLLHLAIINKQFKTAKLLQSKKINTTIQDCEGNRAVDYQKRKRLKYFFSHEENPKLDLKNEENQSQKVILPL